MFRTSGPPSAYELRTSSEFADFHEEEDPQPPGISMSLTPENRSLVERCAGPLVLIEMRAGQAHLEWATVERLLNAARAEGPVTADGDVAGLADLLERMRAVALAARTYYDGYCQDEADDPDFVGCSDEQHQAAAALRDALKDYADDEALRTIQSLAALSAPTKSDELRKAGEPDEIEQKFRAVGFTRDAINYPLSERAFEWLCAFNGITPVKAPWAWRYAPNAYMQRYLNERAARPEQGRGGGG